MSDSQAMALWGMFFIGYLGSFGFISGKRTHKIYSIIWIAFWCGPPLIVVWLRGVMG